MLILGKYSDESILVLELGYCGTLDQVVDGGSHQVFKIIMSCHGIFTSAKDYKIFCNITNADGSGSTL